MRRGRVPQHASRDLVGRLVGRDMPPAHGTRAIHSGAESGAVVGQKVDARIGKATAYEGAQLALGVALPGDLAQFEGRRLRPPDSQAGQVSPDSRAIVREGSIGDFRWRDRPLADGTGLS